MSNEIDSSPLVFSREWPNRRLAWPARPSSSKRKKSAAFAAPPDRMEQRRHPEQGAADKAAGKLTRSPRWRRSQTLRRRQVEAYTRYAGFLLTTCDRGRSLV